MTNSHSPSSAGSADLKPCPFCGGPAYFYENEVDFIPKCSVACDECPAGFDACEDTKAEVAALWNARTGDAAQGAVEISQHIGWLKQYLAGMTEHNWRDMWMLAEWQLDALAAAQPPAALVDLTDPVVVHANMLRGTIAKPTWEQIKHLYPEHFQSSAATEGLPSKSAMETALRYMQLAAARYEKDARYVSGHGEGAEIHRDAARCIAFAMQAQPQPTRVTFEQIIASLNYDGSDADSLTVGEIRRALP